MKPKILNLLFVLLLLLILSCEDQKVNPLDITKYNPEKKDSRMEWFRQAKFGIMVHWGPATVGGVDIGWGRHCYIPEYGYEPDFNPLTMLRREIYDSLYLRFNPVEFNPNEWMQTVKNAGAGYFVFVTKHHDGFCMFDNEFTDYKITSKNSPYGKDIVKEIADAAHKNGLRLGWYYSQRDWYNPWYLTNGHGKYIDMMHSHIEKLLKGYGKIDLLWFDGGTVDFNLWDPFTLRNKIYSINPDILINDRFHQDLGDYRTPEGFVGNYSPKYWESVISIGENWSWVQNQQIKSSRDIILMLCKAAGNNGNLLLNITPDSLGRIEDNQKNALEETGEWLQKYGSLIYNVKPGPYSSDWYWCVSSMKDNTLYFIVLQHKMRWKYFLPLIDESDITKIELITDQDISIKKTGSRLQIDFDDNFMEVPFIIKIDYNKNIENLFVNRIIL